MPMRRLINFFLVIFLVIQFPGILQALDPATPLPQYLRFDWTRSNGLPQNSIHAIQQTADGFLWLATPSGLVRFDGRQFRIFDRSNTPQLTNDRIQAIHEDIYHRLWIGTDGGGLCCLRTDGWSRLTTADGLSSDHIRSISSDLTGTVWIGTDYGLNRLTAEGIQTFTDRQGLPDNIITALDVDSRGFLWIGTLRGGVVQFQEGTVRTYGFRQGLRDLAVLSIYVDRLSNLWIGTLNGLYVLEGGSGLIRFIRGSAYSPVTAIAEDAQGNIWVATLADGLKRLEDGKLGGVSSREGFPADYLHSLWLDREDNLWIGSDADGLFLLKNRRVENITVREGLPESAVSAVLLSRSGDLWIGTRTGGLCRLTSGRVAAAWNTDRGLSSNQITALAEDLQGTVWIGTHDRGLNRLHQEQIDPVDLGQEVNSRTITTLLPDDNGLLWIGTDHGLYSLRPEDPETVFATGPETHYISTLLKTRNRKLYIGTRQGLYQYQDKVMEKVSSGVLAADPDISALFEDESGALWIGTGGDGLLCLSEEGVQNWSVAQGLPDNHIFSIIQDLQGYLWFSSYNGVFRIERDDLLRQLSADSSFLSVIWYDRSDGMASSRCSDLGSPAAARTSAGLLYYPTAAGLTIFDLNRLPPPPTPSEVVIENLHVDGEPIYPAEQLKLAYPIKHLEFSFAVPQLSALEKPRLFYQMEGIDSSWRQPESFPGHQANYYLLPPGDYRLRVVNITAGPSRETTLRFSVTPAWYQRSGFKIFLITLIAVLFAVTLYIRQGRSRRARLDKYKTSTLDPERAEALVPRLQALMEQEKVYLDPRLSLNSLAKMLRIHPNHLSRIINERFGLSYNDFVNQYRIKEAQRLMREPGSEERNILQILYDVGFYSKSVFNTAFKKFTGMTPSQYRKRQDTR